MSARDVERLEKDVEIQPGLREEINRALSAAPDAAAASAILRTLGYGISEEELRTATDRRRELKDEEMEKVAGGFEIISIGGPFDFTPLSWITFTSGRYAGPPAGLLAK